MERGGDCAAAVAAAGSVVSGGRGGSRARWGRAGWAAGREASRAARRSQDGDLELEEDDEKKKKRICVVHAMRYVQ